MLIYFTRTENGISHERLIETNEISWAHFFDMPKESGHENGLVLKFKDGSKLKYIDKTARKLWVKIRSLGEKI